jgi:hypothetical protein
MWQSPAIFLQQAISASVMCELGRQANKGVIIHNTSKTTITLGRTLAIY